MENWSVAIHLIVLLSYLPMTYCAYRVLRANRKQQRAEWELRQIVDKDQNNEEFKEALDTTVYKTKDYVIPLFYVTIVLAVLYTITHPIAIQTGVWSGLLESNVLKARFEDIGFTMPELAVGRMLFWCWLGAYIYSVERTIRHYLNDDLSPNVYISATKRFLVAFIVGSIASLGIAAVGDVVNLENNSFLATLYLISFIVGVFPERGMRWLATSAARVLGNHPEEDEENKLSKINGITYWHRGRLEDEGIETIQNLATAHMLTLVVQTPYDVSQVVDWVDQAILIVYTTNDQQQKFKNAGLYRASQVLAAARTDSEMIAEVTDLSVETIKLLAGGLATAANIKPICRYRGLISTHQEQTQPLNQPFLSDNVAIDVVPAA
jgi:hypothetical protein